MPGANLGLQLVRLESGGDAFTILGRFPPGFERNVTGGYHVAEEFLVLDGSLELDGRERGRGDLTFVPASFKRGLMRSPGGCTVLAWFGGPAIFHPASELEQGDGRGCVTVHVLDGDRNATLLSTTEARWLRRERVGPGAIGEGTEIMDLALTHWARVESGALPVDITGPALVRLPETARGRVPGWS